MQTRVIGGGLLLLAGGAAWWVYRNAMHPLATNQQAVIAGGPVPNFARFNPADFSLALLPETATVQPVSTDFRTSPAPDIWSRITGEALPAPAGFRTPPTFPQ